MLAQLRDELDRRFSVDDIKTLCFDLKLDPEKWPPSGKPGLIQNLLLELERTQRLDELQPLVRKLRPDAAWPVNDDDDGASPSSAARPLSVFLCHSSKDKATVRGLYQRLKSQGIQPWLDEEDILPGQDWDREIRKAVVGSDVILVCLSKNAIGATGYLQREIQSVLDAADEQPKESIFVIPLKLEECAVLERLRKWQWVNYFDERGYTKLLRAFDERAKSVGATFVMSAEVASPNVQQVAPTQVPKSRLLAFGSAVTLLLIVAAMFMVIRGASNQSGALSLTPSLVRTGLSTRASITPDVAATSTPLLTSEPAPTDLPTQASATAGVAAATAPQLTSTPLPSLTLELAPGVQMEFVRVLAGEFLMGSDPSKDQAVYADEQPQHRVNLSDYYIGKFEVTNAQYAIFAKEAGRNFQMSTGKDDHPVVNVSWNDADAFGKWLSGKTGKAVDLPTEAEWEKACRGTEGRLYPWGDVFDSQKLNSVERGPNNPTPIGKYSPAGDSLYGVADMSGNVWEWVADWYDETQYKNRFGLQSLVKDPKGPTSGAYRVRRGGAFSGDGNYARCAFRSRLRPISRRDDYGFRVAVRSHHP